MAEFTGGDFELVIFVSYAAITVVSLAAVMFIYSVIRIIFVLTGLDEWFKRRFNKCKCDFSMNMMDPSQSTEKQQEN